MASKSDKITENLPIYKSAYELTRYVQVYTKNFPRNYKLSLGKQLQDLSFKMVMLIFAANSAKGKSPQRRSRLNNCIFHLKEFQLTFRLCKDLTLISNKQYANLLQLSDDFGRQANGWKRTCS